MQRRTIPTILLAFGFVLGLTATAIAAPSAGPRNFVAPLSGDQEAIPVDTNARGVANLQLSRDGTALSYRLNVANISDVTMAHIHLGASNGPVVVWLHTQEQAPELVPGRVSGTLASGTITADDLVNDLAGADLSDLVDEILAGNAWVNVHTLAHPGGEIAGNIDRPRGRIGG